MSIREAHVVLCMVLLGTVLLPCSARASEGFEDLATAVKSGADEKAVFAVLYPVDDTIQTLIDPVTFRPVSFFIDQKEGRHSAKEITTFDYGKGVDRQ